MNGAQVEPGEYEALYRLHYTRVVGLCRLLLADPCEAEDVAQEVFLKLFRAFQSPQQVIAWGPWISRVAVNACHDRRRSGWWRRGRAAQEPGWEGARLGESGLEDGTHGTHGAQGAWEGLSPEEEMLSREVRGRIWQAFGDLPLRQREVFVLRYQEGWSTAAVAKALGLSAGSVKRHLFRAVRHLRQALGDRA